jgi:hypothetical protein
MCHRTDGLGVPLTALCARAVEVFLNVPGYVCFSPPLFWQPAHQSTSFLAAAPGSGSGSAARSSATTSSRTMISTLAPASFLTWRTNSGRRLRASLIDNFTA